MKVDFLFFLLTADGKFVEGFELLWRFSGMEIVTVASKVKAAWPSTKDFCFYKGFNVF